MGIWESSAWAEERSLPVRCTRPDPRNVVEHLLGGRAVSFSPHVTFTPFASARACSARCVFCSETLVARGSRTLAASLRPTRAYGALLRRALAALRGVRFGVSISGLEATDDVDWLEDTLDALGAHEAESTVAEKVLYSNGAGLAAETQGGRLVPRLERYGLTRIEISRHHPDAARNQTIMRFRRDEPIARGDVFERALRVLAETLPTRLVCIVQRGGVDDFESAERYVAWAEANGVHDIVFREASRVPGTYVNNRTLRVIDQTRVAIDSLLACVWPRGAPPRAGFDLIEAMDGYYYYNIRFRWRGRTTVTFEASDYEDMKRSHASVVVHKMVFFANGRLCADWDPDQRILLDVQKDGAGVHT